MEQMSGQEVLAEVQTNVDAQSGEVDEASADKTEAKPDDVKAKPDEMEAPTAEMEAKPDEVKAKPDEMEAKADEVEPTSNVLKHTLDELKPTPARSNCVTEEVNSPLVERHQDIISTPLHAGSVRPPKHTVPEEASECLCWGCGEFGQNGSEDGKDVIIDAALLPSFSDNGRYGRVKLMACGSSHTVVVTDSNEVFAWGNGSSGQLGCGDKESYACPQEVRLEKGHVITGLACGSRHTVILTQEGKCFSFGNNFYAQLGYNFRMKNYKENQVLPHLLQPIAHHVVKSVACGEKHTLFLFATGQVAVCGQNSYGQLGTGDSEEILSPKVNERLEDIEHIACGAGHSIAVTGSGELYAWGNGRACGMRRQDVLFPMRKFTCHENIIMVAAGSGHSTALTGSGSVYSFGGGMNGQLGHGEDIRYLQNPRLLHRDLFDGLRISLIQCGEQYSAALTEDGQLYMWGKNSHVIPLRDDSENSLYEPTRIDIGDKRLRLLACGSWHAIGVTGEPEWHGWPEVFSESEIEDVSDTETTSSWGLEGTHSRMQEILRLEDESCLERITLPTTNLGRQKTVLSLEEFYAPTPGPVTPLLCSAPHCYSYPNEKQEEQTISRNGGDSLNDDSLEDLGVIPNNVTGDQDVLDASLTRDSAGCENSKYSHSKQSIILEPDNNIGECASTTEPTPEPDKLKKPPPRQPSKPVVRPKPPSLPRSRTFAGASAFSKELKQPSTLVSRSGLVDFSYMDNFVPSKKPVKKPVSFEVSKVRLQGSPIGDIVSPHKHPAMHQPPRLTKAHTIYGRFNLSHISSHGSKTKSPPNSKVIRKFTPEPKPAQQTVKNIPRSGSFPDLSPQSTRTSKTVMARKPLSLNRRPMFSSASSWQSRSKPGAWVVGTPVRKNDDKT